MSDKFTGYIRTWFPERGFGFIRNHKTGADTFVARADIQGDPNKIVEQARCEYRITNYVRKGKTETKAVEVVILPAQTVHEVLATPAPNAKPYIAPIIPDLTVLAVDTKPQGELRFDAKETFEWR